jgi:hypothetical protein
MPALPVLLKPFVRNPFIVPLVPIPIMVSVVLSPPWMYIRIEARNTVIIPPVTVIIVRTIPPAFPWAPPPAVPEEQVYTYIRSDVDTVRVRYRYHIRRCVEYDGWRQRSSCLWCPGCPWFSLLRYRRFRLFRWLL